MALPLVAGMIAMNVVSAIPQMMMMHQMNKQHETQSQALQAMMGQGNQQMAAITGMTGGAVPGQQMPGLA